ncbi:MAG: methylated-DNA--[protein]-cysteine S-methyltransferase [Anaerolineales bacterium]|nr:methylated-DNA--[protein]-cysteine S-methyltransferase [Anaerolineales bacterium]
MSTQNNQFHTDYQRVAAALEFLSNHHREQPSLEEIAAQVHLSPTHFQKLFKRWAGVSPNQFRQFLTIEYAKRELRNASSVLDTALAAGLSGPGRLHDLFVTWEAITPGEYRKAGDGLEIRYGFQPTQFGTALLATTDRGICALRFVTASESATLQNLQAEWPGASFRPVPTETAALAERLFAAPADGEERPFHLFLKGTNFQVSVWRALLAIPAGRLLAYSDVAALPGKPSATRAVASAIAQNPVGYLIPCHRVINRIGGLHQYRWGQVRKQAIIGWEASQQYAIAQP